MKANIGSRVFEVADEPADVWGWIGTRDWEGDVFRAMEKRLGPESTFLDIGAWIGTMAIFAQCRRVVAVEPDPVAFEILKRNVELNRSDVELVREGIAGRDGMVEMGSGYLGASTTRMNPIAAEGIGAWEDGHRFEVHCSTLSGFVERHEIKAPLFIKIDVEGAEGEIIRDSMDWIDENKPDMSIELHPGWWENPAAVRADLSRLTGIYGSVSETRGGKMVFLHA